MLTFSTQSAKRSPLQQGGDFYSCSHLSVIGGGFEYNMDHYIHDTDDTGKQKKKSKAKNSYNNNFSLRRTYITVSYL